MDVDSAIRLAVETGKVTIGSKSTLDAILKRKAKLVIVASNCPKNLRRDAERYAKLANIPLFEYKGSSVELGTVCGKPFVVAMLGIIDPGNSDILEVIAK